MRVFISWSGDRSKQMAMALRDWLPQVMQHVAPFMSSKDIEKGTVPLQEISEQLKLAGAGIVCCTPEKKLSQWLNYEGGALAQKLPEEGRLCTCLFQMKNTDVTGPLGLFQHTQAGDKEEMRQLVHSLNNSSGDQRLRPELLDPAFDKWWPDLQERIACIPEKQPEIPEPRNIESMVEETLNIVREMANSFHPRRTAPLRIDTLLKSPFLEALYPTAERMPDGIFRPIPDGQRTVAIKFDPSLIKNSTSP